MGTYITSFCRLVLGIFVAPSRSIPPPPAQAAPELTSYTCTVSTEPGKGPEDAKAHHVRDVNGRLVCFQNPNPSFGIFRNITFVQGLRMYFRYGVDFL